MKTARIEWRRTYELRYDKMHHGYWCACCGTWFKDDFVYIVDEDNATWVRDMSYCPSCGAEFTKQGKWTHEDL